MFQAVQSHKPVTQIREPVHEPSHHHFLTDISLAYIFYICWLASYVGEWIANVAGGLFNLEVHLL